MRVSKPSVDDPVCINHQRRVRPRLDDHVHAVQHVLVLPLVLAALVPRARDARARAARDAALDVHGRHWAHVLGMRYLCVFKFISFVFSKSGKSVLVLALRALRLRQRVPKRQGPRSQIPKGRG